MAKKTTKKIVQESLPDMEIVESPQRLASDAIRAMTRSGPSMADLRKKYLGEDAAEDADEATEDDVEVKQVRAKQTPADPVDDLGQRTVIISKTKGVIEGSQG